MQASSDRVVNDAVAVHENFISRAMDAIGVFGIAVVEGQILPGPERASPRQTHAVDDGEVDQSATPNDAVTIDVVSIPREPGQPWPTGGEEPATQHLPELDQVVR